ncbi:response regulator transcription factor [Niabella sp. W65]|nr:response regulator transcription factor [Niabella sp. W65]MCH7363301.1 response regulator transcription factor [Niabella sp. W65]
MLDDHLTLAIVDDHPVVIEGLKAVLKERAYINTLSFTAGKAFIDFIKEHTVDFVLLDVMLPDISGIDLCREITGIAPDTIVLGLSNQAERSIILQMLHNGASGYLLKNASAEELLGCIEEAQAGKIVFSNEVKTIMAKPSRFDLRGMPSLTRREKEILRLIADGKTSQQIAAVLFLSVFTIETPAQYFPETAG